MTDPGLLIRGASLDGRYTLVEPVGSGPGWVRWLASDGVLGRRVVVLCVTAEGQSCAAALDAARRASALDEPRLVRVLDAGQAGVVHFVVEEPLEDASSLAQVLAERTLPAEETRRIVGEIAGALDVAGRRGLHHLALSPDAIWLLPDGTVKVRGLATEAALLGIDETTADASRADAHGLLRLTYAALSAHWPAGRPDESTGGLPPAPVHDGGLVPPSELAPSVPAEFDALLSQLDRPADTVIASPAAVADRLRPWAPAPLIDYGAIDYGATASVAQAPAPETPEPAAPTQPPAAPETPEPAAPATPAASAARQASTPPAQPATTDARLSEVLVETDAAPEPPAPLVPERIVAHPERPDPRMALGMVAALVVLFGALGIWGLPRLGGIDLDSASPRRPTAASTPSPTAAGTTPGPTDATLAAVAILRGASFEPDGDGQVASRSAAAAWDGDPATLWRSNKWYSSEDFGGLNRRGYGLVADLGQITPVRRVTVTLPTSQDITVYVSNQANLNSATRIGESAGRSGQLVFAVPGDSPVPGQLVIIMVTKLGADGAGRYRAMVSELEVAK